MIALSIEQIVASLVQAKKLYRGSVHDCGAVFRTKRASWTTQAPGARGVLAQT